MSTSSIPPLSGRRGAYSLILHRTSLAIFLEAVKESSMHTNKKIKITDDRKTFYSFRYFYKDLMRLAKVGERAQRLAMGHTAEDGG